jgi:16S rRNA (adenine1518-N6/adenine1519-N6)-dimethyltransferase
LKQKEVKDILNSVGLQPNRLRGQNFLVDEKVVEMMIELANLSSNEVVVEVGPGLGVLTERLIENSDKVIGVEIEPTLSDYLSKNLNSDLEIIESDILDLDLDKYNRKGEWKIVASLPYQITSPFIRKVIRLNRRPKKMVLLVQREVGERLVAKPGQSARGWLSVLVEFFYQAEIKKIVKPNSFYPQPKVDSAILVLNSKGGDLDQIKGLGFEKVLKAGFAQKRKKLVNSLANNIVNLDKIRLNKILEDIDLDSNLRAEDLSLSDWMKLFSMIENRVEI